MKSLQKFGAGLVLAMLSGAALAQTTSSYDTLTSAVDWADVSTAILAVGAAIVGVLVVFKGMKLVLRAVRGA